MFDQLTLSGNIQVQPLSVSQSSTYKDRSADQAVDGDLTTTSHTLCAWNTILWYRMKFDAVYCFTEVVIVQSHWEKHNADRMDGIKVFVVNREKKTESLCGVLKVSDDLTIEGQTYRIPCDLKCGDEVKLTLRHDKGRYHVKACIHMKEITSFGKGN